MYRTKPVIGTAALATKDRMRAIGVHRRRRNFEHAVVANGADQLPVARVRPRLRREDHVHALGIVEAGDLREEAIGLLFETRVRRGDKRVSRPTRSGAEGRGHLLRDVRVDVHHTDCTQLARSESGTATSRCSSKAASLRSSSSPTSLIAAMPKLENWSLGLSNEKRPAPSAYAQIAVCNGA